MIQHKPIISSPVVLCIILLCAALSGALESTPASNKPLPELSQNTATSHYAAATPVQSYKVVAIYPHDSRAYTQGLFFREGYLYEGTGLYGQSTLRKIDLKTGKTVMSIKLSPKIFGEGITFWENKIVQLTWRAGKGFVYSKDSLQLVDQFDYETEGWGITYDGKRLIMSDGTARLHFLSPVTFQKTGQVTVYDQNKPVTKLNELEYINGSIYANVWETNRIAIIDPKSGQVRSWINLDKLTHISGGSIAKKPLNGIAHDEQTGRIFVTGKLWPKVYEIKLIPAN